jgi:hypothetical protein
MPADAFAPVADDRAKPQQDLIWLKGFPPGYD